MSNQSVEEFVNGFECLEPPQTAMISLTHALTWIAFGKSISNDLLAGHFVYANSDQIAQIRGEIISSIRTLTDLISRKEIYANGIYQQSDSTSPLKFDDYGNKNPRRVDFDLQKIRNFRQYDIVHDGLREGGGFTGGFDHGVFEYQIKDNAGRAYLYVQVSRQDVLNNCSPSIAPMSLDELYQWCLDWVKAGKGGELKAWAEFSKHPRRGTLKRDPHFRPAFQCATAALKGV